MADRKFELTTNANNKSKTFVEKLSRTRCQIFTDSIPDYAEPDHLFNIFTPFGRIEQVTIQPPHNHPDKLCVAFIDFESKESAKMAVKACNGQYLFPGFNSSSGTPLPKNFVDMNTNQGRNKISENQPRSARSNDQKGLQSEPDKQLEVVTLTKTREYVLALLKKERFLRMVGQMTGCIVQPYHDKVDIKGKEHRVKKAQKMIEEGFEKEIESSTQVREQQAKEPQRVQSGKKSWTNLAYESSPEKRFKIDPRKDVLDPAETSQEGSMASTLNLEANSEGLRDGDSLIAKIESEKVNVAEEYRYRRKEENISSSKSRSRNSPNERRRTRSPKREVKSELDNSLERAAEIQLAMLENASGVKREIKEERVGKEPRRRSRSRDRHRRSKSRDKKDRSRRRTRSRSPKGPHKSSRRSRSRGRKRSKERSGKTYSRDDSQETITYEEAEQVYKKSFQEKCKILNDYAEDENEKYELRKFMECMEALPDIAGKQFDPDMFIDQEKVDATLAHGNLLGKESEYLKRYVKFELKTWPQMTLKEQLGGEN